VLLVQFTHGLLDPRVVEVDSFAASVVDRYPVGTLEARPRARADASEQPVVPIEPGENRSGDGGRIIDHDPPIRSSRRFFL